MTKDVQLAVVDGSALTEKDVMTSIDKVISDLYQSGDLTKATRVVGVMDKINDVSGKAKAKLLWGIANWYKETGQAEKRNDTFEDYMETETGNRSVTVKRYVNVWEQIENCVIPVEVQKRPIRDLIPVANALSQGFDFSKDAWKKIAQAANSSEVAEIVRTVKNKSPRKSGIQITIGRDGAITAWKDKQGYAVGYLFVEDENEVVKKARTRIIDGAGIMEK